MKNTINFMTLSEYQQTAARTCPTLNEKDDHLTDNLHMVLGMVTEVGELADVFKKDMAYGKPIDWVNIGEEVADVMWYLVNFCRINQIDLQAELAKNIAKLKVRFPDKFSGEAAINRDVAAERIELER